MSENEPIVAVAAPGLALSASPGGQAILGLLLVGALGFLGWRMVSRLRRRTDLRLGLDGEMATGEELDQLMLRGCRVFHDFPAEKFNIDHVVVGPGGVYGLQALVNSTICRLKLPFDTERRVGQLGECLVQAEQRLGKDHGPEGSGVTGRRNAEPLVFFSRRGYVRRSVDDPD